MLNGVCFSIKNLRLKEVQLVFLSVKKFNEILKYYPKDSCEKEGILNPQK
jgi:hypothetical protein